MAFCPFCRHRGGEWIKLPGTGAVQSFVVVHRAFDPAFAGQVPYVVAHVALDGAVDPTVGYLQQNIQQAAGFEATFALLTKDRFDLKEGGVATVFIGIGLLLTLGGIYAWCSEPVSE